MVKKKFYTLRKKMIRKMKNMRRVCCFRMYLFRFWEPVEDILIGTAGVFLQSLAYLLDFDDEVGIVDYKASVHISKDSIKTIRFIFRV